METGEIKQEDYERMYVKCKKDKCEYVSPLEGGLELAEDCRVKCPKCGSNGVVKESDFVEVLG